MKILRCLIFGPALSRGLVLSTKSSSANRRSQTNMAAASTSLVDKVFLVTGSSDGIGRHTASRLAAEGATVFIHGRREAKVRAAIDDIKAQGSRDAKVEGIVADVSSLRGMNQLCDEVLARTDRLDCLVNNAGVWETSLRHSDDGLENTFAVNVLAPYVITGRLLDLIARAPDGGRVVTVASQMVSNSVDFDNLQFQHGRYSDSHAYAQSKLMDIMFNVELAKRAPAGVTCASLHPGVIDTKLLREGVGMFGGTPLTSANDQFYVASSGDLKGKTGNFYVNRRVTKPPRPARNDEMCSELWGVLEKLSGLSY